MYYFQAVISDLRTFLYSPKTSRFLLLKKRTYNLDDMSKLLKKKYPPFLYFKCSLLFILTKISADRQWRKNDPSREVLEQLVRSTGLWERCTFQATGHYQCDYYDNFFIGKLLYDHNSSLSPF